MMHEYHVYRTNVVFFFSVFVTANTSSVDVRSGLQDLRLFPGLAYIGQVIYPPGIADLNTYVHRTRYERRLRQKNASSQPRARQDQYVSMRRVSLVSSVSPSRLIAFPRASFTRTKTRTVSSPRSCFSFSSSRRYFLAISMSNGNLL